MTQLLDTNTSVSRSSADARAYSLVASAFAGRPVDVVAGNPGEPAWTDGRTITVDPALGLQATTEAIVIQAALIGAGSLAPVVMRRLGGRRHLSRRYLEIEAARALDVARDLLPGSAGHLLAAAASVRTTDPRGSLKLARSSRHLTPYAFDAGVIRPRDVLLAAKSSAEGGSDGESSPRRRVTEPAVDPGASDRAVPVAEVDAMSYRSVGGRGNLLTRALQRFSSAAGAGSTSGGSPGAEDRMFRSPGQSDGSHSLMPSIGGSPDNSHRGSAARRIRYPEWDNRSKRYRNDWCTVREVPPMQMGSGDDLGNEHLGLQAPLARMGRGLELRRRQRHGDDIDLDAAVERSIAVANGHDPSDAVYVAAVRQRRDLSVLVLLDVSGSANEPGVGRVPVHIHQRRVAAALTTVLYRLGDRVALHAFQSNGRHSVRMTVVKDFAESSDHRTAARLASLRPGAYSRLGAAIRHGSNVLEQDGGTTRRLLVVVSDGLAFDHGYDRSRGIEDVRRALGETRGRGIGCLCLTVGALGTSTDLRRAFGTAAYASIGVPEQLAPVVGGLMETALRGAEVPRRVQQSSREGAR